jgi:hypothetical protein
MRAPKEAWIVWDKTVPATMQSGPIGTEDFVREWVRKKEQWRRSQGSCDHEAHPRYEAKRLVVE